MKWLKKQKRNILLRDVGRQHQEAKRLFQKAAEGKIKLFTSIRDWLQQALQIFTKSNLSLEDAFNLIYAQNNKAKDFKTFDKKLNTIYRSL